MLTRQQIPNLLTFGRVLAAPVCLVIITCTPPPVHKVLFWIFLAASITDFFDGHLARKWNATSPLGALLDPIADKLLVTVLLLHLANGYGLSIFPVAVIILRELYISGLREFLAAKNITLPVSHGGKLKTTLQMVGITVMLAATALGIPDAAPLGKDIIALAAAFAVASAIQYTKASLPHLRG